MIHPLRRSGLSLVGMASRTREQIITEATPGLRAKVRVSPTSRRLLQLHGLRCSFSSVIGHQVCVDDASLGIRRLGNDGKRRKVGGELLPIGEEWEESAYTNAGGRAARRTFDSMISIVRWALPTPAIMQSLAHGRVLQAGSKVAALRQFLTLVRGWHSNPHKHTFPRRVRELGLLRTMLLALIDVPIDGPQQKEGDAALGLLALHFNRA